jgi:transketolase
MNDAPFQIPWRRAAVPPTVEDAANAIRALAMDAVERAKSGHPGLPMGMATVAAVLFTRCLKFDPAAPDWPDRDRFVLSAGHGSMLLYAALHLAGYPGMSIGQLRNFRQWGALTPGHPEYGHTPGVETTTGPLGQGLANAVGMALAERMLRERLGAALVDHHTFVIAGDGCLMEGISHEAISLAGHLKLARLIVLFDDNRISIDGPTSLACSDDTLARFAASGWAVRAIDGNDAEAVAQAITAARAGDRPNLIACRTVIGYGAPGKQGTEKAHGAPLGESEVAAARVKLGWPHPAFVVPDAVRAPWLAAAARGAAARRDWERRLAQAGDDARAFLHGGAAEAAFVAIAELRARWLAEPPNLASRQASQRVLDVLAAAMPNLVGGSADLTHSNLTQAKGQTAVTPQDCRGSYIHYGVREHAMAAAMNGIALHRPLIPYGGTFLAFADYCRPAIRLAALMRLRVIHVMTHDSIGLGEDGPTHQPVEHLAALRAIPNLHVFRPADAVETAEAWEAALAEAHTPSILCLSRQTLPPLPRADGCDGGVRRGAYVLHEPEGGRAVTLIGTGSEVTLAVRAAELLAAAGISAAVVSAPCFSLFAQQHDDYRARVLGAAPRVGVEAAVEGDWARWLGERRGFVGMTGFGASAPADVLYGKFAITAEAVATAARRLLGRD